MSESRDILKEEFQDEEYRHAYAEDFLNTSVATQIRTLREQRGWTQEDFAQRIGTKQAGVSRLENVNHSVWKTETLHKIARACDVRLRITFETFGTLLDEAEGFSRKALERPTFADDPVFHEREAASISLPTSNAINRILNTQLERPTRLPGSLLSRVPARQQGSQDHIEERSLRSMAMGNFTSHAEFLRAREKKLSAQVADGQQKPHQELPQGLRPMQRNAAQ